MEKKGKAYEEITLNHYNDENHLCLRGEPQELLVLFTAEHASR